ncbi:MAG: hypothetical protein ABIK66_06960 [candidate division WOR-3 bacterium]
MSPLLFGGKFSSMLDNVKSMGVRRKGRKLSLVLIFQYFLLKLIVVNVAILCSLTIWKDKENQARYGFLAYL